MDTLILYFVLLTYLNGRKEELGIGNLTVSFLAVGITVFFMFLQAHLGL